MKYYSDNSKQYIDSTINCDMAEQYNLFLKYFSGKSILDVGFGSARDMLHFQSLGYIVFGVDPTPEFCDNAKRYGFSAICSPIEEYTSQIKFDGIWACASLLHCVNLKVAFKSCYDLLNDGGILYASLKYGDFVGEKNGRFFHYMNEEILNSILKELDFSLIEKTITFDVRKDRADEKWINIVLQK
ncbi:MAG: class I SAM-dependent methyltransferase [Christensenella sp.]|nr:class I SAM-dependent methyltransferase [Christensenella sp.]